MTCAIAIPLYKSIPDDFETRSLTQCLQILHRHPIRFVTHDQLNFDIYRQICNSFAIEFTPIFFPKCTFNNIDSYNRLMLSKEFYSSFIDFEYILIHQLDAYVFQDQIDYWTCQDYDYIGAPWFENFGSYEDGQKLWRVGNGGFSLRKVNSFLHRLNSHTAALSFTRLREARQAQSLIARMCSLPLDLARMTGFRNNVSFHFSRLQLNEDYLWSAFLDRSRIPLKIPTIEKALDFSIERSPEYLMSQRTTLPMGCHAWTKYSWGKFAYLFNN